MPLFDSKGNEIKTPYEAFHFKVSPSIYEYFSQHPEGVTVTVSDIQVENYLKVVTVNGEGSI